MLLPAAMNATVKADVRFGDVTVDGADSFAAVDRGWGERHRGAGTDQTIVPPTGASGPAVTIHIDVADGNISVTRG